MLTHKVKKLLNRAMMDDVFLADIKSADNDKKPNIFSDEIEKVIFAYVYYGYLVALYGDNWDKETT